MKNLTKVTLLVLICLAALFPTAARADGIIIPDPPPCDVCPPPPCPPPYPCPPPSAMVQLVIRYHKVSVTINDQIAVTRVDQVFFNPNDWAVEGQYIFPLPAGAAVTSFVLWVDGKPVEAQMLDAEQARQQYQQIVSSLRDPALLEYAGEGAVQAHIFPIPPQGERRIELEYSQALPAENGLVRYVYPLSTEKFSLWPLEKVAVNVDIRATASIRAAYSPTHAIQVSRESSTHVRVGYEASQVTPDTDFAVYYSLGEQPALHLLSYRDPGDLKDADGFFLLMLAPRPETRDQAVPKDVLLVLDRSGSMEGEKFQQAQQALYYILQHLNENDRFNVISFSTGLDSYAPGLRLASEAAQATQWVERLNALGSTDINRALLEAAAMADEERPTYLIFLTDGLPTEGVVESPKILDNFAAAARKSIRLFAFGVGYDVDTFLLDSLAQAHHGATTYVLPGERIDETLSAFYAKISAPVLTDLELDFGALSTYDLYPTPLPDLFSGSQIILLGRYRQGGTTAITLRGVVDDRVQTLEFPGQIFAQSSTGEYPLSSLPRLWATRKIGYLLNQVRLKGADPETIDQIVRLSIRYGIVTPYTSYLVNEESPLGAAEQERIAAQQYQQLQGMPAAPVYGEMAVQKAADLGGMEGALAPAAPSQESGDRIRSAGARTFLSDGEKWVDTAFDPALMQPVQVVFLSRDYFALAAARPDLAAAFALGPSVIAISDGVAYEVVPEGSTVAPLEFPPTFTPGALQTPVAVHLLTPSPVATTTPEAVVAPASSWTCAGGLLPVLIVLAGLAWVNLRRRGR